MNEHKQSYVPALGFHWLTRVYDPVVATVRRENTFKKQLVAQAQVRPGDRVLDLGCSTETRPIMLKRACPEATVVGLDGDPAVLAITREKVAAANVEIESLEGMAFAQR